MHKYKHTHMTLRYNYNYVYHICTLSHTHTHARTHACTHAHTHTHARMCICTHARTHACTRTRTHTHTTPMQPTQCYLLDKHTSASPIKNGLSVFTMYWENMVYTFSLALLDCIHWVRKKGLVDGLYHFCLTNTHFWGGH